MPTFMLQNHQKSWNPGIQRKAVFFFSTWKSDCLTWKFLRLPCVKKQSLREKISKSARENSQVCVKILKKNNAWKLKFYTWKKNKNCMRENKKVPVKKSWKIIKCTFFWRHFSMLCLFFLVSSGFFIFDPKICAWN